MTRILGAKKLREARDDAQAPVTLMLSLSFARPFDRGRGANVFLAALGRAASEAPEATLRVQELEAGGTPERDVLLDELGQHVGTSGQGWAIAWTSATRVQKSGIGVSGNTGHGAATIRRSSWSTFA